MKSAALWFVLALAVGTLFAHAALPGIAPASDLWDYSQESRQLARGEGFTSLYTYPVFLGQDDAPFPVRWRMPLYGVLGAILLRIGIALPAGFLYLGAVAHALLVALAFWLAARMHSPRVGAWTAACALACPLLLDFYNPGMSQAPAAVLGLLVWILLLGRGGAWKTTLAAIAAAGAWYLRGETLLFVPVWLWVAARSSGWRRAAAFGIVLIACSLPWLIASARSGSGTIQGNPMLLYTSEFPGYSSSRMLNVTLPGMLEYVTHHPIAFAARFVKDVLGYLLDFLDGVGPVALGAAFVGLAIGGLRQGAALARRHAPFLIAIVLQILAMSALERSPRFLVPVLPLAFVLIAALAEPALERVARSRALPLLLLAVVLERGAHVGHQRCDALRRFPPVPVEAASALEDRARAWPRDRWVLSDAPDWVAWHLDRPALFFPLLAQTDSLSQARPLAAIWLSPEARRRNVADGDTAWVGVMDRLERVPGFNAPERLPGGSRLYVVRP